MLVGECIRRGHLDLFEGPVVVFVRTVRCIPRPRYSLPTHTGTTAVTIGHCIFQSVFQRFG